jgi:phytoene dehydrogenase-like protein
MHPVSDPSGRNDSPVIVVGAGLAGLACAVALHESGVEVVVLEASDGVGGRVRTDLIDGFIVDRGFQVTLTAYPELTRQFDVDALDLRAFDPGALVWRDGKGSPVSDPFRMPSGIVSTTFAPIGSLGDKLRIARLRSRVRRGNTARLLAGNDITTRSALREDGFSDTILQRFFGPLVGGIQLDPELGDSRRMFDVIFRMLADGDSAVPAAGMQAIPEQLAKRLPHGAVRFGARVTGASAAGATVADGNEMAGSAVVIATEGPVASELLGIAPVGSKSAGCVCFAADEAPTDSKMVILDGTGAGPVLNVAVMSNVAATYAPPGKHLVVAALPGVCDGDIEMLARRQLRGWWGGQIDEWEWLATYRIPHGQPSQAPPFSPKLPVHLDDGRFVCGDHRDTASIQGALFSGRRCAEAILRARSR